MLGKKFGQTAVYLVAGAHISRYFTYDTEVKKMKPPQSIPGYTLVTHCSKH